MGRGIALAFLCGTAAIGCDGSDDELALHTSFTVTSTGANPSPLDPLASQTIDVDIVWNVVNNGNGAGTDPMGCKSMTLFGPATRTAHGGTATLVQTEILDRLGDWDLRLQLCDAGAGQSSLALDSAINELNLALGCFGIPASAMRKGGDGYPRISSFTATECSATILDVVNNKELSSQGYSITVTTGPDELP